MLMPKPPRLGREILLSPRVLAHRQPCCADDEASGRTAHSNLVDPTKPKRSWRRLAQEIPAAEIVEAED